MYCCAVLVSQVIGHVLVHEARRVKRLRLEANGLVITPHVSMPNKTYSVREVRALHFPRPFLFLLLVWPLCSRSARLSQPRRRSRTPVQRLRLSQG